MSELAEKEAPTNESHYLLKYLNKFSSPISTATSSSAVPPSDSKSILAVPPPANLPTLSTLDDKATTSHSDCPLVYWTYASPDSWIVIVEERSNLTFQIQLLASKVSVHWTVTAPVHLHNYLKLPQQSTILQSLHGVHDIEAPGCCVPLETNTTLVTRSVIQGYRVLKIPLASFSQITLL